MSYELCALCLRRQVLVEWSARFPHWWKAKSIKALCFLLLFVFPSICFAGSSSPYPFPGNNGQTGLWDMPNARIMPDWNVRANFAYADPYRYWSGTIGLLDRFEFNGRLTDITTVPFAGQEFARDKAIDLKFLLFKERDWLPSVAAGATDIHGTGLFTSRYVAFSKVIGPFDFTFGVGQGILGGEVTSGRGDDSAREFLLSSVTEANTRAFGGFEFHITDDFSFVGEYSSYDYEDLRGSTKAKWPINIGLKYRLADHFLTSLSWQKGEELSFSLGLTFPFEPEGLLSWKKEPFYEPTEKVRMDSFLAKNKVLAYLVADQVSMAGFKGVRAAAKQDAIWVEFVNNRYLSNQKAMGRVARIVDLTAPPRIKWFYLALVKDGMVIHSWKVHRDIFNAFLDWRVDDMSIWDNSEHQMGGSRLWDEFVSRSDSLILKEAPRGQEKLRIHIAPRIESLVNDPSGFFKTAVSMMTTLDYQPWKGGLFTSSFRTNLHNNISTSNVVEEPEPTRTDFVDYLSDRNPRLTTLAFDQIVQLPEDVWARAAVGAFESAYMGVGGEVFRFFGDGRIGVGIEGGYFRKRDIDNQFKVKEGSPDYYTGFVNLYYHLWPSQGIDLGLKIGRFLGGDEGVRIDVSRTFKYFTVGAWLTITDTSDFVADFNRGYEDKGIYLSVPLSVFFDSDLVGRLNYILRPWTRDPGGIVAQPRHLYPFADDGNLVHFKQHLMDMRN